MEEFVAGLSYEARKELFDLLHDCRHKSRTARRDELFVALTQLVAMLEQAVPRESTGDRFRKLVESAGELNVTVLASARLRKPKRPTASKKAPSGD